MPYIPMLDSRKNHADACSAGMKKSGLVSTTDFNRVGRNYLKRNTQSKMPTFTLTCCNGARGRVQGVRITHGRPTPIG